MFEWGAVGTVEHAAADEGFVEVVAAEEAGDCGIELIDEREDAGVIDCGGLVEKAARVEESLVAGDADGVGLVHYWVG